MTTGRINQVSAIEPEGRGGQSAGALALPSSPQKQGAGGNRQTNLTESRPPVHFFCTIEKIEFSKDKIRRKVQAGYITHTNAFFLFLPFFFILGFQISPERPTRKETQKRAMRYGCFQDTMASSQCRLWALFPQVFN